MTYYIERGVKSHCSREIIFVMGSLTTCDPGDVYNTINECKQANIRCSFIGLTAEVFIFKHLCEQTKGLHWVIMDEVHFSDILKQIALPLPSNVSTHKHSLFVPYFKNLIVL